MSTQEAVKAVPGSELVDPVGVAAELRDRFRVGAAERDRTRSFPYEQCAEFRASGLLGLMVPREHGGYGGTFVDLMKVVNVISAGDSNIGQMYQLHTGGIRLLQEFASPEVQAKWLPRFASGELWITNAYSEVGTPSVNHFNTTVRRDGDGWRLNGKKFYCTGSLAGDITFGPCQVAEIRRGAGLLHPHRRRGRDDPRRLVGLRPAHHGERHDRVRRRLDPRRALPRQPRHRRRRRWRGDLAELPGGPHRRLRRDRPQRPRRRRRVRPRAGPRLVREHRRGGERGPLRPAPRRRDEDRGRGGRAALAARRRALRRRRREPDRRQRPRRGLGGHRRGAPGRRRGGDVRRLDPVPGRCGAGSVLEKYGFDRHWRNARTLSLHNPLDFKSAHAGDFLLNDRLPAVDSYN